MEAQQHGDQLKRGLKNRHIQLIALGGAIGTGLFLGSASVIQSAGPGIILGYAIAGFIAFLIMRQLGEMVVEEPVAGSFSHFAYKYWGSFAGFASGWNYWVLYVLVAMAELTAVGKYIQFWYPEIPTWASAAAFFVIIKDRRIQNLHHYERAVRLFVPHPRLPIHNIPRFEGSLLIQLLKRRSQSFTFSHFRCLTWLNGY